MTSYPPYYLLVVGRQISFAMGWLVSVFGPEFLLL